MDSALTVGRHTTRRVNCGARCGGAPATVLHGPPFSFPSLSLIPRRKTEICPLSSRRGLVFMGSLHSDYSCASCFLSPLQMIWCFFFQKRLQKICAYLFLRNYNIIRLPYTFLSVIRNGIRYHPPNISFSLFTLVIFNCSRRPFDCALWCKSVASFKDTGEIWISRDHKVKCNYTGALLKAVEWGRSFEKIRSPFKLREAPRKDILAINFG